VAQGFVHDDIVLEVVMVVGCIATDARCAILLANSGLIQALAEILEDQSNNDEIVLQVIYSMYCLVRHSETREVILNELSAADVPPHRNLVNMIIEMLQHKCDRIRVTSSLFLDVIMDVDEQQMDKQIQMGNANAVRGYTQAGYSLCQWPLCSSRAATGGTVGAADSNAQVRVVQRGVDEGDRGRCAAGGLL
jgi:hypothetical protein